MDLSCCNPAIGSEVDKTKLSVVSGQDLTYEAATSMEGSYHFIHANCLPRRAERSTCGGGMLEGIHPVRFGI
jgi:hypothetical protein